MCRIVVALASLLLLALPGCATPTEETEAIPQLVELATVDLNAYRAASGDPVAEGPLLEDGAEYVVTVMGTISFWDLPNVTYTVCAGELEEEPMFPSPDRSNGPVAIDARYRFVLFEGEPECDEPDPVPLLTESFDLSVDGGTTFSAPQGVEPAAYDVDHTYAFEVTGAGHPVVFRIKDEISNDNYGVLRIKVEGWE